MSAALPKPFRAQKVTNGNANEVITNYMMMNGETIYGIDTDEDYLKKFYKNEYEEEEERTSVSGLIQRLTTDGSGNTYMPFKYRLNRLNGVHLKVGIIREDMIKDDYTFTSISDKKFKEAVYEIYVRTSVHVN